MKPWVSADKSKMSSFRSGTNSVKGGLAWGGGAAPMGFKKCVSMPNPGLTPWAMKMYRPCRAHLRLSSQYTLLF